MKVAVAGIASSASSQVSAPECTGSSTGTWRHPDRQPPHSSSACRVSAVAVEPVALTEALAATVAEE